MSPDTQDPPTDEQDPLCVHFADCVVIGGCLLRPCEYEQEML